MTSAKTDLHPSESELAGLLDGSLAAGARKDIEEHVARCDECLAAVVSSHEAVESWRKTQPKYKTERKGPMNKINIYLLLTIASFALSFMMPRYFLQLLVATLLLGIKWIVDAKTTRMLVMIYEAWRHGGDKEASRIMERFEDSRKGRF